MRASCPLAIIAQSALPAARSRLSPSRPRALANRVVRADAVTSPPANASASDRTAAEASSSSASDAIVAPPGCVIYFAYGSNVNTKTMNGVRGISPSASYHAVLRGYELVFNVPGLPYVEPGFASVRRIGTTTATSDDAVADDGDADIINDDGSDSSLSKYSREVHGVAYVVTDEEWRYILRTETSYETEVVTLAGYPDAGGTSITAITLTYPDVDVGTKLWPSKRYLGLLREGAEEWNLDEGWRRYLNEVVKPFEPATNPAAPLVAAVSVPTLALVTAPIGIAVAARNAGAKLAKSRQNPGGAEIDLADAATAAVVDGFNVLTGVTWGLHNALWAPLFGSGANNESDGGDGARG